MKEISEKYKLLLAILGMVGAIYCAYMWGYNARANDTEHRILGYDDQSEGCFTRDEVDYFIYGKL